MDALNAYLISERHSFNDTSVEVRLSLALLDDKLMGSIDSDALYQSACRLLNWAQIMLGNYHREQLSEMVTRSNTGEWRNEKLSVSSSEDVQGMLQFVELIGNGTSCSGLEHDFSIVASGNAKPGVGGMHGQTRLHGHTRSLNVPGNSWKTSNSHIGCEINVSITRNPKKATV